ncbi:uncharacterized protein LOC127720674 [Mytilus californianus]|uniref:uncharacterized protein LOC127720674 n=1 Tax=Mytilus californianus TaxID=6549 RepID=UPI00224826A1|nr:uncharacterized protein LOC127720674 [Mytilus californianus]
MLRMAKASEGKSESLDFYKYLCQKIGSEKVVKIRRLVSTVRDIGQNGKVITSGSKGEGLDLNGSDVDMMYVDPYGKVYQTETEVQSQIYPLPLIMNTEETQPCFTQLLILNHDIKTTPNVLQKHHRGFMLSSELYKLSCKNVAQVSIPALFSGKIHGPCISNKEDTLDIAWCFKCDKWIFQAEPWVCRPRTTWPPPEIISKIVSSGVLIVPIGCKGSTNEHLEWRISFSVAEKFLIFSFSHTQLLCYAMFKVLLKEVVEKYQNLKGLFCSYFLKTLMFWILEETDPYLWRPDNIIPCFMACLQRLLYCVRYSILSHYFIPENNLFLLRFNTNNKEKIINILENLYGIGIDCFASSETLQEYQRLSYKISESFISRNSSFLQQVMLIFRNAYTNGRAARVLRLMYNFLNSSRTVLSRFVFVLEISEASMYFSEETQYLNSAGNKHHYFRYKHDLSYLVIGLHSDAVSGLLKLASFFYVHKKYIASLTVITHTLQKFTNEKIDIRFFRYTKKLSHIQKYVLSLMKKEKLYTIIKSLTIHPFGFGKESSIIPRELQPDVTRIYSSFHPLSFAYFLNFLCYYHLHDLTSCRQSLQRLRQSQWILSEGGTIVCQPESVNTVIFCGIAHQLLGETYNARLTFREADGLDKYNLTSAASRLSSLI